MLWTSCFCSLSIRFLVSRNLYTCYLMVAPPLCAGSVGAGSLSLWFHEYIHREELNLWDWRLGFFRVCSQEPHVYHFRWLRWWKFWLWAGEIKMIFWTLNWCYNGVILLWALGKGQCICTWEENEALGQRVSCDKQNFVMTPIFSLCVYKPCIYPSPWVQGKSVTIMGCYSMHMLHYVAKRLLHK